MFLNEKGRQSAFWDEQKKKKKRGGGVWAEVTKAGWVRVMGGRLREAGHRASAGGGGGGLAVREEWGV